MQRTRPSYDDLRAAVLAAHGENLAAGLVSDDCLQALVELGILVRVGGGLIETTSHGDRIYRRLSIGERVKELEPNIAEA